MNTIEQLQATNRELMQDIPANLNKIRANDEKIKQLKRSELLTRVNNDQRRKREIALLVWNCEQPDHDITCNDGSFHSTKVKKYPNLQSLQYARAKWEEGHLTVISVSSEKFNMYHAKYEYNKPTVYTRPESFEEFLKLNNIMLADMTLDQLNDIEQRNQQAIDEYKKAIEKFDKTKAELNLYSLSSWGLFSQRNAGHVYEFNING